MNTPTHFFELRFKGNIHAAHKRRADVSHMVYALSGRTYMTPVGFSSLAVYIEDTADAVMFKLSIDPGEINIERDDEPINDFLLI
jgi:hypothetical protein